MAVAAMMGSANRLANDFIHLSHLYSFRSDADANCGGTGFVTPKNASPPH
jgi:hypothetical protein